MPKFTKKMTKGIKNLFSTNSSTLQTCQSNNNANDDDNIDNCSTQSELRQNHMGSCVGGKIVFDEKDNAKPPCAVIVTIKSGSSYDAIFTSVPQVSPDESVAVKVFHFNYATIPDILRCIQGKSCQSANATVARVIHEMLDCRKEVDPDSFVVNFECCSGCSCNGYEEGSAESVNSLLAWMIQEKHVAMFADFSLKSLIKEWDTDVLGPNPFINLGDTSRSLAIQFEPEKLLESPNTQLQNLGRMCNKGSAFISVLPSTIVFTIDPKVANTPAYEVEILTVVGSTTGKNFDIKKDGSTGTVGHAILRYPSGACILVSSGHWMELNHLDGVDEDSLMKTTLATMGLTEANDLRCELDSATTQLEKASVMQKRAKRTLLSSAPCKYSSR